MINFDRENDIVILKSKNGSKNSTDLISSIRQSYYFGNFTGYDVEFTNGNKFFYKKENVEIQHFIRDVNIKDKIVNVDEKICSNIKSVKLFKNGFYKVTFNNGSSKLTTNFNLEIDKRSTTLDRFNYFKKLASYQASLSNDDESPEIYLLKQYEKIREINENSVLSKYLLGKDISPMKNNNIIISPFDFNKSQNDATQKAFTNNISVIEGPPGTGKTQVILNIISNIIIRNKTVGVISNNNAAVENIYDKLDELGLSFFIARLGKFENRKNFFDSNNSLKIDKFIDEEKEKFVNFPFEAQRKLINSLYETEQKIYLLRSELSEIQIEYNHFKETNKIDILEINSKFVLSSSNFIKMKTILENVRKIKWSTKRFLKKKCGLRYKPILLEKIILTLEVKYFSLKIEEITKEIENLEHFLSINDFESLKETYKKQSMLFFKKELSLKYLSKSDLKLSFDDYKDNFNKFIDFYPVVLSTSNSINSSINKDFLFDYLIIDEASQSDLLSTVVAMNTAKNLIVVGDSKQLSQIENENLYEFSSELSLSLKINSEYQYRNNSILSSIKKVFPLVPTTLLKEHYRCHPKIINFCNKMFYNNELIVMTKDSGDDPFSIIHTVPGNHGRRNPFGSGYYNDREAEEIYSDITENYLTNISYGIISPFVSQINVISKKFEGFSFKSNQFKCETVHKFQGQQRDLIYLSYAINDLSEKTTDNKENRLYNFINNKKLFNVAISRAKKKIILVLSDNLYSSNNNLIADLISYINYYSTSVKSGKVVSVFDLLYSVNKDKLLELVKISQFKKIIHPSEEILANVISVLLKENYPNYSFSMHINLKKIINDYSSFNEKEIKYLKHPFTHVDFLIYDRITHENKLVIEVDGVTFHEKIKKQLEHDLLKDRALKANGLKILRLKTNEAKEVSKIKSSLS
ncbi:MAG: AAA family ATPase [Acholeplasmatales bacterium]|nr:AAA family ATPase [Acholeplasmatales bacterium]